jgi:protein TonB
LERRPFADLVVSRPARGHLAFPLSVGVHAAMVAAVVLASMLAPEPLPAASPMPGPDVVMPEVRPPVAVSIVPAPARPSSSAAAPAVRAVHAGPGPRPDLTGAGDPRGDEGPAPCLTGCGAGDGPGSGDGIPGAALPGLSGGAAADPGPRRVRANVEVREPRRIAYVAPVYPELARRAGLEADVVVACVIDTDGRVTEAQVRSGHVLLDAATLQAVARWRYLPTLLDGVPVSVEMTVTVRFRLRR